MSHVSSLIASPIPQIDRPVFRWPIQIYWEDTDAGGVVYHSNYLKFFERTRTEWLRHQGVVQTELVKIHNVVFVLRGVSMLYLKPARMDDRCEILVAPASLGRASLGVWHSMRKISESPSSSDPKSSGEVSRASKPDHSNSDLCRAHVELACVRADTFAPARIPVELYRLFEQASASGP